MRIQQYLCALALALVACLRPVAAEPIRDYYSEPGLNPFKDSLNQHFSEYIDPFSGTLQLKYTDVHVPGNGGMDIDITRSYTSLPTDSYPAMAINGLGWTMHFGRIVVPQQHLNKICNQAGFSFNTSDNPSLELPDGGRELLVLSRLHNDGSLITRSNWIARCLTNRAGMLVTAPDGTQYTMDQFDNFQGEPSYYTTRIEDVHNNWIAIDYAQNAMGIHYMTQIRRSEGGVSVTFEYEDVDTNGIALSAVVSYGQRWTYQYETIPGFFFPYYKQLVRVIRPDGRSWLYSYNPLMPDPIPDNGIPDQGIASYSLNSVTYPYGARISYAYQHVKFDRDSPLKTTSIYTKTVSGSQVEGGTWTFQFAPQSEYYGDAAAGGLRYDVTTVTAPEAIYKYKHFGKDYYVADDGLMVFTRASFVGLLSVKETWKRQLNGGIVERQAFSWGQRKVSEEDFWHGGDRTWWRDDGTYAALLQGEYSSRDGEIHNGTYAHARLFSQFDEFGNPGRVFEHSNIAGHPSKETRYTYYFDAARWIVGLPMDETHRRSLNGVEVTEGTVEREFDTFADLRRIVDFGEETRYTYTGAGDMETMRDARGKITTYSDYKRGIARHEERPEGVIISRTVNNDGTLASETNGRGYLTSYTYDDMYRLTGINYPVKADVSINYDESSGAVNRVLSRGNYRQTEKINDFGETLRIERRDAATGQTNVRTSRFDAHGREIFRSYPNSTAGTDTTYDAVGRIERIQHPDNNFVRYVYDDSRVSVTNERGFQTTYLNYVLGVGYTTDDPVTIDEPEGVSTIIRRDIFGNIVSLFQGQRTGGSTVLGYEKTYDYDARKLLVESYEPEVGTTVYGHDAVGNVTSEKVNQLPEVTFVYDGLNRRTRVDFSDATPDIVTVYDKNGNIERVTKGNTEWFNVYDENDNLRNERLTISHALFAPRIYALAYDYSDLDVVSNITYPSGLAVDYAPDALGRPTRVGTFATNITYHPSGAVASYRAGTGVTVTFALNSRLMTQSISAPGVVSLSYDYDASGNVTQITDGIDSAKNVTMGSGAYDGLDRLRSATGAWGTATFSYDHNGNFVTKEVGAKGMRYWLDAHRRARQIDRYDPATPSQYRGSLRFEYDDRGNATVRRQLTVEGNTSTIDEKLFDFDAASHLIRARVNSVTGSGTTAIVSKDFTYDGNGERVVEHKHGSYDIRFSVQGRDGKLMFEDSVTECTRTDHIHLGALTIAKSDDKPASTTLDTDGDQLTDCLETQLGLNPNSAADAAADADGDGLTNLQEFQAGTSITRSDTDGDGVSDRDEVQRDLTDPNDTDTDGDGLPDDVEAANPQLDPRSADKDHDGVSDFWEVRLATNPAASDGLLDSDGDGFSNRQESGAKADPQLAAKRPARGAQMWSAQSLGPISMRPAIGRDRTIYVAGDDAKVYAYHPDGTVRWTFGLPGQKLHEPTVGPDGSIYLVSNVLGVTIDGAPRSFVRALSAEGVERWVWATKEFISTPVAVGEKGRLYFGGFEVSPNFNRGLVNSLAANGSDEKSLTTAFIRSGPAVAPNGDVYFTTETRELYAFNKDLGLRWSYSMGGYHSDEPPAIANDGTIYVTNQGGYIHAVTPTGSDRWSRLITANTHPSAVAIGADGTVYVGDYQNKLLALRPADGTPVWSVATSGSAYTPAIAANGTLYATTYAGSLVAFGANGAVQWSLETGSSIVSPPVIDRDGTIYVGSLGGQLHAVADNAGGPARSAWPMHRHDSAASNYMCFNEPAFSIVADGDGDHIDDCAELRYGLDPANPADGNADPDGDGLRNFEEHQAGSRLDVADTDGDGLNDGLEVLTYHTSPTAVDTDHDGVNDAREIALGKNPNDAADAAGDSDSDGFSDRQEALANTDPLNASSSPVRGQVLLNVADPGPRREVAVGRDGTIYQVTPFNAAGLQALYPDFTIKWSVPLYIALGPVIGPDGTIYLIGDRDGSGFQRIFAYWPNGLQRWVHTFRWEAAGLGVLERPAVGADGSFYYLRRSLQFGSRVVALDAEGRPKAGWPADGASVFAFEQSTLAVGPTGNVAIYDAWNSLTLLSPTGERLWETRNAAIADDSSVQGGPLFSADGTIYVRNDSGLHAIDPANGSRKWVRPGILWSEPLIDASGNLIVYCQSGSSRLCAISPTGTDVWQETTGYTFVFTTTPAIDADGSIIALTDNGRVVAFNGNGTVRWDAALPTGTLSVNYPVILGDGSIYLAPNDRRVVLAGAGRGLAANAAWPARHRDNKGSRNAAGLTDAAPNPAPAVIITAPTQVSIDVEVGENVSVRATASDFADGDLSDAIRWSSSLDGQFATGASASLSSLRIGTHTITATVTDSQNNTASASFTVNKAVFPPRVTLSGPADGSVYDVGQVVNFQASAVDQLDGSISDRIRWVSDRDGQFHQGAMFTYSGLSVGVHHITASATDFAGATGSVSFTVTVEVRPPAIDISLPAADGAVEIGLATQFSGSANDGNDGDVSASLRWTSNRDGLIGTGRTFTTSSLSAGVHVITVTASDSQGGAATVTLPINVDRHPPKLRVMEPVEDWVSALDASSVRTSALAEDLRDGFLNSSIQWSSTLDGPLGTGGSDTFRGPLSTGVHYIIATVTDSDNLTSTVERKVTMRSSTNFAPTVTILAPERDAFAYVGEPLLLQGASADSGAAAPTIQWSSDLDGNLGTGTSLTLSNLRVGTHTIKALVVDAGGAKAAARVRLPVLATPANYAPTITFQPLPLNARYTSDSAFPLTATAIDREEGNISSRLQWSSDLAGPLGNGATVFPAGLVEGFHQITARVTDSFGNTVSKTFVLFISSSGGGAATFFSDGFSPGDISQWQIVDDGTTTPSSWSIVSGRLQEAGDAQANDTGLDPVAKPGTYARHKYGDYWLDYRLNAQLNSSDDDAIGLMFRVIDNNNYYRFSMDRERSYRRLVKKVNGVFTTLWSDTTRYTQNQNINVAITAQGSTISLAIGPNNTTPLQVFSGTDTSHRRGTIGLYAWSENAAKFDSLNVTNLRLATSNDPPLVTISSPADNSNVVVGTPVTLSASAIDFEDGAVSQPLSWSSSRDGVLGAGASLSVNSLSLGTHVITASTIDSDGLAGSTTVTINVNQPFNNPPTLNVTAPTEGATFNIGTNVALTGTASDIEDGTISNGITWTSNRSGQVATGGSTGVATLPAGAHVITARIQDSGGKFVTVTRNITIVVPGNNQPVITLSAPLNGAARVVGDSVALSATASDTEDGNLSAQIAWSSSINGALGTGTSVNVTTLTGGVHTITATVNDSMGGTRSVAVTLTVVPTAALLLRDDFNDNNSNGWAATTQGTVSAPAAWSVASGVLRQTSDVSSTPVTAATIPKLGTFMRYTNTGTWSNYSVTAELMSSDNDTLGVMFRHSGTGSSQSYYRFSMDSERANRRLAKLRSNGTWSTLWEDSTVFTLNRWYVFEAIANGTTLTIKLDGVQLWTGTDATNPISSGSVAMYSWQNTGANFDNVLVRNLSVPLSTSGEPRRGLDRLRRSEPMLVSSKPRPKPEPPRAPERVALIAGLANEYRQSAGGVR